MLTILQIKNHPQNQTLFFKQCSDRVFTAFMTLIAGAFFFQRVSLSALMLYSLTLSVYVVDFVVVEYVKVLDHSENMWLYT